MSDLAKLKVCFLAGTLGQGGAERQLYYILKVLKEQGAGLGLLCLTRGEFWEERIRELGIPVAWVGQQGSRLLRLSRILWQLRQSPPDIFQGQHVYTNLYVAAAARVLGLRSIGAIRTDAIRESRALGIAGYWSLRAPNIIAANSQAAIRNAMEMGVAAMRLHFLPNVVDTGQFKPAHRASKDRIEVIAVGRHIKQKRLDRFLSIIARLRRQSGVRIKALIVGDGPQRMQLERRAAELALLPEVVEFKGTVSAMIPIYQRGDILVLTSDWEGTPNAVLEAMASGLPVVAPRVGDLPEIIQHGETGYLADAGDEDYMTDALLRLINDPHLRIEMGSRAREYIETHHSLDRLPTFLEDLYKVALA